MIDIKANEESMARARAAAEKARASFANSFVPMRQCAIFLDAWNKRNMQTQGGKVGGWTPFKYGGRITSKEKANAKSGGHWVNTTAKLLRDTGVLEHSILPFATNTNAGIGSDLPYGAYHEHGTRTLPQRRLMPRKADVETEVNQIFDNWMKKNIAEVMR